MTGRQRKSWLGVHSIVQWFSIAQSRSQLITRIASSIVFLVGCLVLIGGWGMNIAVFKSLFPGAAEMKANTALCFILAGISLALQTRRQSSWIAKGCAIAVLVIAGLTLSQYLFGWNLGIDELLFKDSLIAPETLYPGRMGDNTALNFVLVGIALLLMGKKTRRSDRTFQTAAICASLIALLAVAGHTYNVQIFYQFFFYSTSMAFHTALVFLVLCLGILSIRSNYGLMKTLTNKFIGGILSRRLIPLAIAIPFLLGWLILQGLRANLYDAAFSLSLLVILLILMLLLVIWKYAQWLNIVDENRNRSSERLRSSQEQLQLALSAANQGIWDWNLKTEVLTWDDRCKKIFGLPADFPVTYEWHLKALHPDDLERVSKAGAIALREQTKFHEEYRTFYPDGTMRWILSQGRAYYDGTGEPERMLGTVIDISDRKQAESALVRTNSILQTVINGTRDVIYVKDLQGRYVLANQAAAIWLNRTVESMLGQDDRALFPDDVARQIQTADRQVIENEEDITYEEQLLKGNELRSLLSAKYPWRNELGELVGLIGISIDVTDLKQAEADLKERNEYIQILYETSRDLLSTYEPLTLVDALFDKLKPLIDLDIYFNYIVDEQKQKLHLMFHGGISAEMAREIEWLEIGQAICGTVAQQRCQIVQPNVQQSTDPKTELVRSLGLTAYSCQPLVSQGKLFGTLGFGSLTRTEFTPGETKLFQAICDRIAIALERSELVSSLQQQTEELKQANRLKDEFLAALSHELRTPLNPILGWTKLLQTQNLPVAKTQEALATIERNAKQQIALVDDLLDISRVVQGQFQLTTQPVNLILILNAAAESVRFAAIAKCITLEYHYPADSLSQVMGDELRLQQIFWNLLANAIKFTPNEGRIDVWLEQVQNNAQISITDTGIGIAAEFLPHVFDRFRQADGSSTRQYGGLGLGLALVKHLVELHGGTVSAESPGEGKGATFKVNLPLLESASFNSPATVNSQQPQPDSSSFPSGSLTGIRVLVVDDEPDNLDLIDFVLTQEGAIITAVTSSAEALTIVAENPPDILISDIGMPGMDGYELLRQVRALPSQQHKLVKAIALTAFAQQEDREKAMNAGFQAYLSKPINLIDLVAAIAEQ